MIREKKLVKCTVHSGLSNDSRIEVEWDYKKYKHFVDALSASE